MLTKAIEVQKYVRASAGRAGISIVFEDANEPRHDGKTIYFQTIATGGSGNPILSIYSCNIDGSNPIQLATYNNIKHLSIGDAF